MKWFHRQRLRDSRDAAAGRRERQAFWDDGGLHMAKKPAAKPTDQSASAAGGSSLIMTILQVAGFGGFALALTVMVAGMHDLGFVDLTHSLHVMIVPMLVLIILSLSLYAFASGKNAAARHAAHAAALEKQKDELEQKIAATEARLETYLGPAHAALIEENEGLKARLEEIRQQEEEKINAEIAGLRAQNTELQDKITNWAVGTVETAISDETRSAA